MDKKTIFTGWNYLMLGVSALNIFLAIREIVKDSGSDQSGPMHYAGLLGILPAVITIMMAVLTIIMAKSGIRGEYSTCRKIAFFVLALNIFAFVLGGSSVLISLIASAVYFYLVLSLDKYKY